MSSTTDIVFSTIHKYGMQSVYPVSNPGGPNYELTKENFAEYFADAQPSVPTHAVELDDGTRLQFIITHTVTRVGGVTEVYHMFGYTDPIDDLAMLADNMKMYFSRAITVRSVQVRDVTGIRNISSVKEDIILTSAWSNECRGMRPGDIFRRLSSDEVFSSHMFGNDTAFVNLVGAFRGEQVKAAYIANESPARYIGSMSDAFFGAVAGEPAGFEGFSKDELFSFSGDRLSEMRFEHHWFFNQLCRDLDFNNGGFVTFGELGQIFELGGVKINLTEIEDRTAKGGWDDSVEAYIANRIINAVNANMTDYGYMKIALQGFLGEKVELRLYEIDMLDGNSFEDYILEFDIKRQPFTAIVANDIKALKKTLPQSSAEFKVSVDIAGIASVDITLDGNERRHFERPMHLIGKTSGQVSPNPGAFDQYVHFFKDSFEVLMSKHMYVEKG